MNKYKKLVSNSIVFTVGTFGSKMISILMVPLYTHLLSTQEYGTIDVLNTSISLLIPFITLEFGQAALRFAIESKNEVEKNKIFSTILLNALVIAIILLLFYPIFSRMNLFGAYNYLFIIQLFLSSFNMLFSQFIRGIGLIKEFAFNGIIMTIITVVSNIVLLVHMGLKIEGYLLSLIIASLISNIYIFYSCKGFQRLRNFTIDTELIRSMIKYSLPIIPNSSMWWVINGSTRYFVLFFVGAAGNGLFAIANKIPALISTATGIFSQAWQISSFEEYNTEDKNQFYSRVFNIYSVFLFISGSGVLVLLKPILQFFVESSFYESWKIVPALIFGVIYQSFSAFLGTNYTASKQTKGAFSTSIYGGVISIISSFALVPLLGGIGAGLSTALSFISMFIIRLKDTRKFVNLTLNKKTFYLSNIILISQSLILFIGDSVEVMIIEILCFLILIFINRLELIKLFNSLPFRKIK